MTHKWEYTLGSREIGSAEVSYCGMRFPISQTEPSSVRLRWENVTCKKCWSRKHQEEMERLEK